jgi:hypothetical protein
MFQTKVVEEFKTHILCTITFFENRAFYDTMWKNVETGKPQMTIWRKRIASWKTKVTYLLTPWSRILLEKLTSLCSYSKNSPHFYGTRRFFTILISARHLSLSWANSIQSPQPPPISLRSILILSSHLRLGLPNASLTKATYALKICNLLLFHCNSCCKNAPQYHTHVHYLFCLLWSCCFSTMS